MARPKKIIPQGTKYTAKLHIAGQVYTTEGPTVREALEAIKLEGTPKAKAIISVSDGTRTIERIMTPVSVMRMFSKSLLMREVQIKNLTNVLT